MAAHPPPGRWRDVAVAARRSPLLLHLAQHDLQPSPSHSSPLSSHLTPALDGLSLPLTTPAWHAAWLALCSRPAALDSPHRSSSAELWRSAPAFRADNVNLLRPEDALACVAVASHWLPLESPHQTLRFDAELALAQEVAYASYLGLSHLILPPICSFAHAPHYARALLASLLAIPSAIILAVTVQLDVHSNPLASWEQWHRLASLCAYHPRLCVALRLCHLPKLDLKSLISTWSAEPVAFLWIPADAFIHNSNKFPVLSSSGQKFFNSMAKFNPAIILSDTTRGLHESGGPLAYIQYIRHLELKLQRIPTDPVETFAGAYLDYLQTPLQPLADNLEAQVYEGFEKDPVKYSKYEEAIFRALCDRPADIVQVIAVCGAGRGPLVTAALSAASRSGRKVSITAIEKNPNSYVTLQEKLQHEWDPKVVEVWFGDMRDYESPEPIDIMVSELLGSFGDNELSPECLDCVMPCLAVDGISIPASYTSLLAPLSSTKIYSRVKEMARFETPYVVMIHAADIISATSSHGSPARDRVQKVWSFDHTCHDMNSSSESVCLPLTNFHNARSSLLTFKIPKQSVCHGFAGYFRATLYDSVIIETHPDSRMSREMLSWFPIFFPLKEPVYCPKDSELDVRLWRLTDQTRRTVWYEWSVEAFLVVKSPISRLSPPNSRPPHSSESPTAGEAMNRVSAAEGQIERQKKGTLWKKKKKKKNDNNASKGDKRVEPLHTRNTTPTVTDDEQRVDGSGSPSLQACCGGKREAMSMSGSSGLEISVDDCEEDSDSGEDAEGHPTHQQETAVCAGEKVSEESSERIMISISSLHNAGGREASVKW